MEDTKLEKIDGHLKRLLAHERKLYESGELINVTHLNSRWIWLESSSSTTTEGKTLVYRPMGDAEILHLVENNVLPDTQPYQAIMEGEGGRTYAEKYLNGKKFTDTHPSTVVEFSVPSELIETLKKRQLKVEDGAMSMGLGNKAGKGLPLFNQSLIDGDSSFRIVKVKRSKKR